MGSTIDPPKRAARDALIGFIAASAQAQAAATKEAQKAGIKHAQTEGEKAYKGRKPSFARQQMETVRDKLAQSAGVSAIAKETGLSRQAIYRLRDEPVEAEVALAKWGL